MNTLPFRLFLLTIVLVPTPLIAGQSDFKCTPMHANTLIDEGDLKADKVFQSLSKPFVVDRESGRVIGGLLDNSGMQILLTDRGSAQESFKVHAHTTTRVVHAMYLRQDHENHLWAFDLQIQ